MSSEDEGTGFLGGLSSSQAQALAALRAALGERIAHPRFTDVLLLRFLRARHFDVGEAGEMLERHLAFRERHGLDGPSWGSPHGLGPASLAFPEMPAMKRCYPHAFHKTDRQGRPLYIERLGQLDVPGLLAEATPERILEYFAYESERQSSHRLPACSLARGRLVQSTCSVLDMEGLGFRTATNSAVLKLVRSIMREQEENFPEVTGNLVIVNAPSAFSMIWSVIKPLLSASTTEKIEVFGARNSAYKDRLLELVAPENLPEFLGGTCTCAGFQGGCMCSDDGPWRDEAIDKALLETPFWEVLRRLSPQGPSAEPRPPEDPAPAVAAAHGAAGAVDPVAGVPEPLPVGKELAPPEAAEGGLGGAPDPRAGGAATAQPEEEASVSPTAAAQTLHCADPSAEPLAELCSAAAAMADATPTSTAAPSTACQAREDASTSTGAAADEPSAGVASEEPEAARQASTSRSDQASTAPSSDDAVRADVGIEQSAEGEGGGHGASEVAAELPTSADGPAGGAPGGARPSADAATCLERTGSTAANVGAATAIGDERRGPPAARAADLAERPEASVCPTADEGADAGEDGAPILGELQMGCGGVREADGRPTAHEGADAGEDGAEGDSPRGLFAARPAEGASGPAGPPGAAEAPRRLGCWVLGAGCLSKRADLAIGLEGPAPPAESDAEEAEAATGYRSGPQTVMARWLRESAQALGPLISCGPRKDP